MSAVHQFVSASLVASFGAMLFITSHFSRTIALQRSHHFKKRWSIR